MTIGAKRCGDWAGIVLIRYKDFVDIEDKVKPAVIAEWLEMLVDE